MICQENGVYWCEHTMYYKDGHEFLKVNTLFKRPHQHKRYSKCLQVNSYGTRKVTNS
jgi:hypothetical protein